MIYIYVYKLEVTFYLLFNCENGVSKIGLDVMVFILFKRSFFPHSSLDEEFRHNVYIYPILAAYSISII